MAKIRLKKKVKKILLILFLVMALFGVSIFGYKDYKPKGSQNLLSYVLDYATDSPTNSSKSLAFDFKSFAVSLHS